MRKIAPPSLAHLLALSDDTGVIQHATHDVPNRSTGYCSDDVSRAFMVAIAMLELEPRNETAAKLATVYLSYLHDAAVGVVHILRDPVGAEIARACSFSAKRTSRSR